MTISIQNKFRRELRSFYSLSMVNIVFSGIAMALGISFGVRNVIVLVEEMKLLSPQFVFTLIGFLAFGISLQWLISSAEILDGVSDIKDEYERKEIALNDDNTTGLIVKMMAYYRDNMSIIHKLSLLSRIAGICFLVNGTIQIINNIIVGMTIASILPAIGMILSFAVGISGIIIPYFFNNYSSVWDYRLQQSVKAERELDKVLEGN